MAKLLMISGDRSVAAGQRGAFYNMLEGLTKHFERIDVICPRPNLKFKIANLKLSGRVFLHPSPWPLWLQPYWIWRQGRRLYRAQSFSLTTVHDYAPFYNGLGARWLQWSTGLPYLLEIHHITGYPRAGNFKEQLYYRLFKIFIRLNTAPAKAVRVVNQTLAAQLQNLGVPAEKILLIPSLYLDLETFCPRPVEKKYDLIFIGRLAENKGVALFVKAAAQMDGQSLVVGDGPLAENLKFKIENLKLQNKIILLGWAKDSSTIAAWLNQSKLLVVASASEGNPRVLGEALACGVPVLSTPVGIAPELLGAGGAGRITAWNPADIARQAWTLLADPAAYQHCRERGLALARRYEQSVAIKYYADQLKRLAGTKRLLVITQKIDANDQLLGFFTAWLKQFASHWQTVLVICLEKGTYPLPANSIVHSLGKERGWPRLVQLVNFYWLIWHRRRGYDAVFVHMNPIWLTLGGWWWRRWGKRTALWYTTRGVTAKLRRAEKLADIIFTASPESFPLPSAKLVVSGHGIDTDFFRPAGQPAVIAAGLKILSVGRIAPVKNYETLIAAAKLLAERALDFSVTMIGAPALPTDRAYADRLKNTIDQLGLHQYFNFLGKVNYAHLPEHYRQHNLFVHLSQTGSLDKVLLEAMACGLTVLSANAAAKSILPSEQLFAPDDPAALAQKILAVRPGQWATAGRTYVLVYHNLKNLITMISRRLHA